MEVCENGNEYESYHGDVSENDSDQSCQQHAPAKPERPAPRAL